MKDPPKQGLFTLGGIVNGVHKPICNGGQTLVRLDGDYK